MIVLITAAMILVLQLSQLAAAYTRQTTVGFECYVLRAGTNEPIARARIMVNKTADPDEALVPQSAPPAASAIVMTDSQGHFVIKDLDSGHYVLVAQRNGFARQSYGERAPGRPGM